MIYISYCPIGVFAFGADKKEVANVLFQNQDMKILESMENCGKKELSGEEMQLIKKLGTKDKLIFELKKAGYEHEFPNPAGDILRANLEAIALKTRFVGSKAEFLELMHSVNYNFTAEKMRTMAVDDKLIVQAVNAIDDMDKSLNTLAIRLREWYGFYFPEVSDRIADHEQFVKYVADVLYRTDIKDIKMEESIGCELGKEDLEELRKYARSVMAFCDGRKNLESYIEKKTKEFAPNLHAIVGSLLSARLLSCAGSLEKLVKFPSSTIQILGAEKALFRFLHGQGTSPKHGIIFMSRYVQQAPNDKRGKIARILASKLSLASKLDYYKGKFMGDKLRQDVDKALEHVLKAKPGKGQHAQKFKHPKDGFKRQDRFKKHKKKKHGRR